MSGMSAAILAVLLLAAAVPAFATDYTVGGNSGWTSGPDYDTWSSGNTFKVGDNLIFTYGGIHTLEEVKKAEYDSCSTSNPIKAYSGGNNKIALTATGTRYFICAAHCSAGMKVSVTVPGSGPTPSTPTTPSTPSTPSTPTPSTPTPSTPTPSDKGAAVGGGFSGGNAMLLAGLFVGVAAFMG